MAAFEFDEASAKPEGVFDPGTAKPEETTSSTRLADVGRSFLQGAAGGAQALTDAAGAGNPVSTRLEAARKALGSRMSPERQAEVANRQRLIKEAEATGSTWEEIKANLGAIAEAPASAIAQGAGSIVPTAAAALLTRGRSLAAPVAVGAAQGAGAVKGSIYDAVTEAHTKAGMAPEQAEELAQEAQSYAGENRRDIVAGAQLGALAGSSGVESALSGAHRAAARTLLRRTAAGALVEGPTEGAQGAQERLASNLALQREGFPVPTMQGVVGQGVMEGSIGTVLGGGVSAVSPDAEAVQPPPAPGQPAVPPAPASPIQGAAPEQQTQPPSTSAIPSESAGGFRAPADPVDLGPTDVEFRESDAAPNPRRTASRAMGIDPAQGPISAAAATAVDSGATITTQHRMAAQQADEEAKKAAKPGDAPPAPRTSKIVERAPAQPVTGPITAAIAGRTQGAADAQGQAQQGQPTSQPGAAVDPRAAARTALAAPAPTAGVPDAVPAPDQGPATQGARAPVTSKESTDAVQATQPLEQAPPDASGAQAPADLAPDGAGAPPEGGPGAQPGDVASQPAAAAGIQPAPEGPGTVDAAAHANAASSPLNDRQEPTQAQKDAGNYPKGHVKIGGLDLSIENPDGSTRSGKDASGKAWSNTLRDHYGYIKGTIGNDKDHVDAFVKPGTPLDYSGKVFVVDQVDPATGKFDEHKVMIGFDNPWQARLAYMRNYAKGWKGLKAITPMEWADFKTWVFDGPKNKALAAVAETKAPAAETTPPAAGPRVIINKIGPDGLTDEERAAGKAPYSNEPPPAGGNATTTAAQSVAEKVAVGDTVFSVPDGKAGVVIRHLDAENTMVRWDGASMPRAFPRNQLTKTAPSAAPKPAKTQVPTTVADVDKALDAIYAIVNNAIDQRTRGYVPIDQLKFNAAVAEARKAGVKVTTQPPGSSGTVTWTFEKPDGSTYTAYQEKSGRGTWIAHPASKGGTSEKPEAAPLADDLDAMFNDVLAEEIAKDEAKAAAQKPMERAAAKARRKRATQRPAGQAVASAAKNTGDALGNAIDGLGALFGAGSKGRLGSGLSFDEETYAKAKPLFQAAIANLKDAAADLREAMRTVIRMVLDKFGADTARNMQPYVTRFIEDMRLETESRKAHTDDHGSRDATSQPGVGKLDSDAVPGADEGRAAPAQQPSAPVDSGDVEAGKPADVPPPAGPDAVGATGLRGTGTDVGSAAGTAGIGDGGDGRQGTGGTRTPDAGAGGRSAAGPDSPGVDPESVSPANPGPGDFIIDDPLKIVGGGQVARFDKNKAAIELRNRLADEGRKPTREEQTVLAGYTGWGSFGQELFQGSWAKPAPKKGWEARDRWLRENLGAKEWEGMQTSIINAHYTDPPTVLAMWDMVRRMGFTGGRVLEPSIGIGNFYGMMPVDMAARSQRSGIELDPVTGSMAQLLYPGANIQIKGYEESTTPDNFYDLVIGNWPFFEQGPADRRYNRLNPTLHDYFFLKAIDQTRPGGLIVGITTKGTMDKKGMNARMEMARKAELLAAFRLPTGAFEEYAGTKVVTDIIILRKRQKPLGIVANVGWLETREHKTREGTPVFVNEYFHNNPDHVIGEIDYGHGTTTFRPGLIVHRPDDMMGQLKRIAGLVPEGAFEADKSVKRISYVANHTKDRTNSLVDTPQGLFVVHGEHLAPANEILKFELKDKDATAKRVAELKSLIKMRQLYAELIDAERGDKGADTQRTTLRNAYEAFIKASGPLSKSFGLQYLRKLDDPFYPSLAALEISVPGKDGKPTYRPATILNESTMRGVRSMKNPSISDAFVLARNEDVNPSVARIAEISGKPEAEVRAALIESGAGFEMPNGDFAPADIYLSGNVRAKLREAQAAAQSGNKAMGRNIEALKKAIPADVPYYKIETQMGATWVPPTAYAEFIGHMLGVKPDGIDVGFHAGAWKVDFPAAYNHRQEARSGFGTPHVPFKRLVRAAIANQTITLKDKDRDGREFILTKETEEVNSKIADMRLKFGEWLWSDPVRRTALEAEYNEVRNAYATPDFDGSFLGFQGMALSLGKGQFNLRQHQIDAIWRALVTRKSLNAHEVGTGKTFTMGGIAVESRRYGIAKKPMLFAHNANSKSVAHEIQMMYPAARVLYVDNLSKENIKVRMMQIANDDWDVIVMPHSIIDRIGFKKKTLMNMAYEELADLQQAAEEAAAEDNVSITDEMWEDEEELAKLRSPTAKNLVKQRLRIITTIEKLAQQATREDSVAFEDMGVDMLLVDEAHEFKKPPIATKMNIKGLQTQTSNRSIALMFLTKYVRANNNGANVHLFTGTPITNTMTEVFHMMRYMMQEEMKESAIADWDGWFGSFAREVNDVELTSTGEYEAVTRLQSFINVPELRRMIGQYMDVVFSDDMPEMKPRSVNGKLLSDKSLTDAERNTLMNGRTEDALDRPYKRTINESSDMSPAQSRVFARVQALADSWKQMSKKSRRDAMLAGAPESPIIHEGIAAKASFDVRLVDATHTAGMEGSKVMEPHPDSKPARTVKNLLEIYRSHPQANQVVFMSQGMAKSVSRSEGPVGQKRQVTYPAFSTMHDMIERLVAAGVPREQIAAVDGSTSKDKRKEIADAMNTGQIRIVFGSTGSLGVGVNMQRNLRAMHHMDAPWMPGDLEQRNGRGHRQGNQWNTVLEFRYITDRLDGKRWQTLARKQKFITDFMKSKGDVRVIEGDVASDEEGDILSTFAEAAGDPRILLREKYKKDLEGLQQRERMHGIAQSDAAQNIDYEKRGIADDQEKLAPAADMVRWLADLLEAQRGDGFKMNVGGKDVATRADAAAELDKASKEMRAGDEGKKIGSYGTLTLYATWYRYADAPHIFVMPRGSEQAVSANGMSLASLESGLRHLRDRAVPDIEDRIARRKEKIKHSTGILAEPFHLADKLAKTKRMLEDLQRDLEVNPVAPPYWLRNGAPIDTEVYRDGKAFTVVGHRWSNTGWFVIGADEKGEVNIPYLEAKDSLGMPLYEAKDFTAPTMTLQPGWYLVTNDKGDTEKAPRHLSAEDIKQLLKHKWSLVRTDPPAAPKQDEQLVEPPAITEPPFEVYQRLEAGPRHRGQMGFNTPDAQFARGNPFYSALAREIERIPAKAQPAFGWASTINGLVKAGKVKQDEVEWSGLTDWLKLQQGKVTREQVLEYLAGNGVQVTETVLGEGGNKGIAYYSEDERWGAEPAEFGSRAEAIDAAMGMFDMNRGEAEQFVSETDETFAAPATDTSSDTKYGQYQLPGGTNYREVLLTLPDAVGRKERDVEERIDGLRLQITEYEDQINASDADEDTDWISKELTDARKELKTARAELGQIQDERKTQYRSSHWDQPNVLAHIRVNDRESVAEGFAVRNKRSGFLGQMFGTKAEAEADLARYPATMAGSLEITTQPRKLRTLFVEEIQSDWGQQGKKDGFKTNISAATHEVVPMRTSSRSSEPDGYGIVRKGDPDQATSDIYRTKDEADAALLAGGQETGGLPRAPFVTKTDAWVALALKRIIKMAVDEGYDRVAFINGEQSADRYDLSKRVEAVRYSRDYQTGKFTISFKPLGARSFEGAGEFNAEKLPDVVGKEVAEKVIAQADAAGKRVPDADVEGILTGLDLKVGGEGMKAFYDSIVPSVLKDVLRKVGGGPIGHIPMVKPTKAFPEGVQQPGFDITPAMRDRAAGGLPMFDRRGDLLRTLRAAVGGKTVQDVRAIVAEVSSKWTVPVEVVATPKDLPIPAPSDARGLYYKGKVYVVASTNRTRGDVLRTLGHEAIAHHGLREMLGREAWDKFMGQIRFAARARPGPLRDISDYVRRTYVDQDGVFNLSERQEADEIAAKVVEEGVDPVTGEFKPGFGMLKAVFSKIAEFLRGLGIPVRFTNLELQGALVRAMRGLEGRGVAVGNAAPAFSRKGDQTDTPEFKAWFGDSKVVDADGKPLVVYHGTTADFVQFDLDKRGASTGVSDAKKGFFFAASGKAASEFTWSSGEMTGSVMPVFLSMHNPFEVRLPGEWEPGKYDAAIDYARREGRDGVIIRGASTLGTIGDVYIAFRPEQIKSAIGNLGTFDPNDPDIRFARAGFGSAQTLSDVTEKLRQAVEPIGTVSLWDKTVGTQFNKATKDRDFKRVFDAYLQQTDDTAHYAIEAERNAPDILLRLESAGDILRGLVQGLAPARRKQHQVNLKAVAKALFANIEGEEGIKQIRYDDDSLRMIFGLTPKQIEMYHQARAAVDQSIERLAQTYAAQMGRDHGMDLQRVRGYDLADTVAMVKTYIQEEHDLQRMVEQQRRALRKQDGTGDELMDETAALDVEFGGEIPRAPTQRQTDEQLRRLDQIEEHARFLLNTGYMPAMRFGEYAVTVTSQGGDEVQHFEMFESQLQANMAAMRLAKEYPGSSVSKSVLNPEQFALFKGVSPETVELFAKFTGADQDEATQAYIALAKSARSVKKRELHRKGIAGFSEDPTRVLASFITSNARQAAMNLNSADITDALASDSLKRKGDVQREAQKLHEYMANPMEEARALRGFMFAHFMGGSIASALVNLTQPVLQTAPYLSQFAGAKTAGIITRSARMAATGKISDADLREAMVRAAEDGITEPHEIHQLMADAGGPAIGGGWQIAWRAGIKAWGSLFALSEAFNRRLTFLAAYQTGKEIGHADPYEFARRAVIETQGLYAKVNRPNWARGAVGATLFTFKQFSIAYIEFFRRLPAKQKALALGILVLAAGIQGLPFADDLEDLIDTIGQSMGYNTNSKKALRKMLTNTLGKELGTVLDVGALSALTAVDVQGRLSMGNLLPATAAFKPSETDKGRTLSELAGPLGGILSAFQKGLGAAQRGDLSAAANEVLPVALKNIGKGVDMASSGIHKDSRGYKVTDVTAAESFIKMLGLQPASVASQTRALSDEIQEKGMVSMMESMIADRWAQGVADQDREQVAQARKTLMEWNGRNPESRILIKPIQIAVRVRKMREDRNERFVRTVAPEQRAQVRRELVP